MAVYKDKARGTWYTNYFIKDYTGKKKKVAKRGFKTKREAAEYERIALMTDKGSLDIPFKDFFEMYKKDISSRVKVNTWITKENIFRNKIMIYFSEIPMNKITVMDVRKWQTDMINYRNRNDEPYSCVYLKTLNNQLSSIFNHAVNIYGLPYNPVRKAGAMGREKSEKKVDFWTKDEYLKFANFIMDKPESYYAFEVLYWTGMRLGEMLALTGNDFNFEKNTVTVSKSYQRINGKDMITSPKTIKSNRTISIPQMLSDEVSEFIRCQYKLKNDERIFTFSKSTLHKDIRRGCDATGLKRIKIHGLRHSHVSLLIEMGYSVLEIADRVGHENERMTYNYAHMFPNKQNEIARNLNFLMEGEDDDE